MQFAELATLDLRVDPEMDALLEALGYVRGEDEPVAPKKASGKMNDSPD